MIQTNGSQRTEVPKPEAKPADDVPRTVARSLLALPAEERDVLILKVEERKSYGEIAAVLGLSREQVSRRVHTGLTSLARQFRSAGILPP
jgi:RNA polymerase sigma factor (sigma-70 family)